MTDRAGRSIGEVLEDLRDEFPDISVSKIRFLESQGLISPQRTASGYRLFSDDDVALLRWILVQQREHYLPLKVIRKRLREGGGPRTADGNGREEAVTRPAPPAEAAPASPEVAGGPGVSPEVDREGVAPVLSREAEDAAEEASWLIPPDAAPAPVEPEQAGTSGPDAAPAPPVASPARIDDGLWDEVGSDRRFTRAEILGQSGLEEKALAELESFGLLTSREGTFDAEALRVAQLAAGFFRFGVEARHLRMYKSFAEREAAFLEQVVMPMVNHRHEESRARAAEALADLARLGQALRLSMLRVALGPAPGDPRAR